MIKPILFTLKIILLPLVVFGQFEVTWNATIDKELTKTGDDAHYFYNELHRMNTGWRFDLAQANFLSTIKFNSHWTINTQFLIERRGGNRIGFFKELDAYVFRVPQLNVQWTSKNEKWKVKAGRILSPFGLFYKNQLFKDRTILPTPLVYSYYTNMSFRRGFIVDLAEENKVELEEGMDWGTSTFYRLGYHSGLQVNFIKSEKLNWSFAIIGNNRDYPFGTSNIEELSVVSRVGYNPSYFSELGLSLSYGRLLEDSDLNIDLDRLGQYSKTDLGFDYKLGKGFFEASGELIFSIYSAPQYLPDLGSFVNDGAALENLLTSMSGYIDLKQELRFLPGSYIAGRLDFLLFNKYDSANNERATWDNAVFRQVIGFGYKIKPFWQVKLALSTQQVADRNWDQHSFRLMSSLHW